MKIARVVVPAVFLVVFAMLSAANVQGQACGASFVNVTVSDPEGKIVSQATIELVAEVPLEEYKKLEGEALVKGRPENNTFLSSPGHLPAVKISAQVAEGIIKRRSPMSMTTDFCGRPLRLRASSAVPKNYQRGENGKGGLGFCTSEGYYHHSFLMKISAPGYASDYFVGPYLGGCHRTYRIVLTRDK